MSKQTNSHRRHHSQRRIAPGSSLYHRSPAIAAPAVVAAAPPAGRETPQPTPAPSQQAEIEFRSRVEATLRERTRPLPQRMAEFHRLLRESRLSSIGAESMLRMLEDSF